MKKAKKARSKPASVKVTDSDDAIGNVAVEAVEADALVVDADDDDGSEQAPDVDMAADDDGDSADASRVSNMSGDEDENNNDEDDTQTQRHSSSQQRPQQRERQSQQGEQQQATHRPHRREVEASSLTVSLSAALVQKLRHSAQDEGISLDSLVSELLAEGVALRAWEIIERKGAMRGITQGNQAGGGNFRPGQQGNHGNNRHSNKSRGPHQGGGGGGGGRRPGGANNNAWMEDKAAFLEYVRNQEKRRR